MTVVHSNSCALGRHVAVLLEYRSGILFHPALEPLATLGDQDILSGRSKLSGGVLRPAYP
jgi:hypothetical protein